MQISYRKYTASIYIDATIDAVYVSPSIRCSTQDTWQNSLKDIELNRYQNELRNEINDWLKLAKIWFPKI